MLLSSKKFALLSIFLFSHFFLTRSQPQPEKNFCITRPTDCYPIRIPVCGYPSNCNNHSCTRTAANACFACLDPAIESYILGECPPWVNPNPDDGKSDDTDEQQVETEVEVEDDFGTCPDVSVAIQVNGDFIEGKFCCETLPEVCPPKYEPVCAILFECIGSTCQTTVNNACEACHDPNVQLYVPGNCSDSFGEEFITQTEAMPEQPPLWTNWEVVKLSEEEEFLFYEGEGQFEDSDDWKIWIWYHSRGL